jgi:hypothetical protein
MQEDMEKRFSNAAEKPTNEFLNTLNGQKMIDAANPSPCGTGVTPKRIKMSKPFSDIIAEIYWLSMTLGDDHLDVLARANADLPVCGKLEADVPIQVALTVNQAGQIQSNIERKEPDAEIDGHTFCGIVLTAISSYFAAPAWAGLLSYLILRVVEAISESLVEKLLRKKIDVPDAGMANPLEDVGKLVDIQVQPSGLLLLGLIPHDSDHVNHFQPQITLEVKEVSNVPSTTKQVEGGIYHKNKTCKDDRPRDFAYTRHWYDGTWHIRLKAVDIPLPVTVDDWTVELGYRTPNSLSTDRETGLLGSAWSGMPVELVASQTLPSGTVYYKAPPFTGVVESRVIVLNTTPLTDFSWEIGTRGEDGNFQLRIQVSVTDGDGKSHLIKTTFDVLGEEIIMGADFDEEQAFCRQKLENELHNLPPRDLVVDIPPWVKTWDPEIMQAVQVQIAMYQDHASAVALLRNGVERFGPGFHQRVQSLPPLPVRKVVR